MSNQVIWTNNLRTVVGNTPMGFYDSDLAFLTESQKSAKWAANRLGYPVLDVELNDIMMYAMFEEAVNEYGYIINTYNIRDSIFNAYGQTVGTSSLQGKTINNSMGRMISLTDVYGTEMGVGGDVDWYHGSIDLYEGQQTYDLNQWAIDNEINSDIKIKRIFHYPKPASVRYFDPFGIPTTSYGANGIDMSFGVNSMLGSGMAFMLRPVYEDILRMQMIEITDSVRRSGYGFELINNKLKIFPIPKDNIKLWFDYIKINETNRIVDNQNQVITDSSNIPYAELTYSQINSVGRQWIRNYFLALCKITLGELRVKYTNIPISTDKEVSLGSQLLEQGKEEKKELIDQLKEMQEKITKQAQLEAKNAEEENLQKIMGRFPLKIFIG